MDVPPDAAGAAAGHRRLNGRTHELTVSAAVKTRSKKLEARAQGRYIQVAGASVACGALAPMDGALTFAACSALAFELQWLQWAAQLTWPLL